MIFLQIKFDTPKIKLAYCVSCCFLLCMNQKKNEREADPMDNQPIIIHISRMLADFPEAPLRAVYMVVRQYHEMIMSRKS